MKVFLTQDVWMKNPSGVFERKYDLSPAESFGKIVPLTTTRNSMLNPKPVIHQIRGIMEENDFGEDDYILPMGDASIVMLVGAIAADLNNGTFTVLSWDKRARKYNPITIEAWS